MALTGTAAKIVEVDDQRTVLTLANRDATNIAFISDDQGMGVTDLNGYPIFPETFISLERKQGDEPQKAYYGVCEAGKTATLAVMEQYGDIVEPVPSVEPHPQQPLRSIDAPRMRRW